MVKQLKSLLPLVLLTILAVLGWEQVAIAKPKVDTVETLLLDMEAFSAEVQKVDENYSQRRGLIGKKQAEERFERALFRYLMADYKRSAPEFFILLETESLDGYDFKKEAEWYLVDSAFQIGQYAIVEEASYQIIEQGPSHLFFTDAVRILLESYGVRNRQDKFQEAMERFVLSGLVESSDSLNYSVGKALFWQEENARAKGALREVAVGSPLYYKAQYFLGGILVSEGSYQDALSFFASAVNPNPQKDAEEELNDLANLALARTYYELAEFTEAISYYQKVGARSKYFVDRLYEMAWTFIGMERWDDAIGVIEVFLVAYPEDEHAIRFQNTLGDLYMKTQEYEKALMTYEKVSEQLVPVQTRLKEVLEQEDIVNELLDARVNGEEVEYGLPYYAQDMLMKNRTLNQASTLVALSREQTSDVKRASDYADEIETVLANEENGLYVFAQDRYSLRQVEISILENILQTLEKEVVLLVKGASETNKQKLEEVARDIASLRSLFGETFVLNQTMEDVLRQYTTMIRGIQIEAEDVLSVNQELQTDVRRFLDTHSQNIGGLPENEKSFIQMALEELDSDLQEDSVRLEEIMNDKTRTILLANLAKTPNINIIETQLVELQRLHNKLLPFWSKTSTPIEKKQQIEKIWASARTSIEDVALIYDSIDDLELRQKRIIMDVLEEQQTDLASFSDEVIALAVRSEELGTQAATRSFEVLNQHVEDRMLGADLGIVKVYWIRKTDIEDEIEQLQLEQATKMKELRNRFDLISTKLYSE